MLLIRLLPFKGLAISSPPPFLHVIEWVSIRIPNKLILHGWEKGVSAYAFTVLSHPAWFLHDKLCKLFWQA